ncbi:MAG: GDCCVxC domain-containing (seleno)protein [Gammaproteobacteria bacterium]|nr:GDCCVxC domain-containing (seleno)protein [Gammaproteobacteria bacterium]
MTVAKKAFNPYSTITCSACGHQSKEKMPTDACQFFYECQNCLKMLRPNKGDCCVYCSFGDVPCPPVQRDTGCC